jgi:hypothetical protein
MGDLLLASVLASAHGVSGSTAGVVVLAVLITAAIFGLSGWHAHRWRYAEADLRTVRARRNAAAKAAWRARRSAALMALVVVVALVLLVAVH